MYTKGPWDLCERGDYGDYDGNCRVILGNDMRIAVVLTSGDKESEDNAKLIVAAPDLLEALEDIVRIAKALTYTSGLTKRQQERIENAFKVIKKAKGE